jgi:stage II sporulation protein D
MRKILYTILFILYAILFQFPARSQQLKIGLFNDSAIQTFIFTAETGTYQLQLDSIRSFKVERGSLFYISLLDSQLSIRDSKSGSFLVSHASLISSDSASTFSLRPAYPAMDLRRYQGNCLFIAGIGRIQTINEVKLNDYLAAVVATEGGTSASIEFYKAQTVLCRTYLMSHITKHATDGFNLCDDVHCQAYHGINNRNPAIRAAVIETENELAVFGDTILITAAYHSNCGGETQNSENEWLQMLPYLRSVKDSFCLNTRNGKWEMKIERTKWLNYLAKNGINYNDNDSLKSLDFPQTTRKAYYAVDGDSIAFRKLRTDWGLKSSFFSVKTDSAGDIILVGKGYGHGIGMCQLGAMNMAQRGYNYKDILNFYFNDISVKKVNEMRHASFH